MTGSNAVNDDLTGDITTSLQASGWTRVEPDLPPPDASATAFTHQRLRLHLLITSGRDEPRCADLVGGAVGNPAAVWSVEIVSPTTEQILAATRAAAATDILTPFGLASAFAEAGWSATGHGRLGTNRASSATRSDGNRTVFHYTAVNTKESHEPGGWIFRGDGLTADATEHTPHAVILAIALS